MIELLLRTARRRYGTAGNSTVGGAVCMVIVCLAL